MRARPRPGLAACPICRLNLLLLRPSVVAVAVPLPPLTKVFDVGGPASSLPVSHITLGDARCATFRHIRGKQWTIGGLAIHEDATRLRAAAQPHHVDGCMEPTSCAYRVHTLESPALGSVTSSTANSQSLRAIKRACLCGRPPADLLPFTVLSPQLGRHVVDKHATARDSITMPCSMWSFTYICCKQ